MQNLLNHLFQQFHIHHSRLSLTKEDFPERVYTEWEMDKFKLVNASMALAYGEIYQKLEEVLKNVEDDTCGRKHRETEKENNIGVPSLPLL